MPKKKPEIISLTIFLSNKVSILNKIKYNMLNKNKQIVKTKSFSVLKRASLLVSRTFTNIKKIKFFFSWFIKEKKSK